MPENPSVSLKNWLKNDYNIRVQADWLSGCVTFFLQENPRIKNQELNQNAYDQWLLANLADMAIPYTQELRKIEEEPTSIQTINGKFALQLQYILDVCKSH
jgi:RecQ-mediated genome instability protein 1